MIPCARARPARRRSLVISAAPWNCAVYDDEYVRFTLNPGRGRHRGAALYRNRRRVPARPHTHTELAQLINSLDQQITPHGAYSPVVPGRAPNPDGHRRRSRYARAVAANKQRCRSPRSSLSRRCRLLPSTRRRRDQRDDHRRPSGSLYAPWPYCALCRHRPRRDRESHVSNSPRQTTCPPPNLTCRSTRPPRPGRAAFLDSHVDGDQQ